MMGNTQHLEGIFSKSMKLFKDTIYCKKIINNPLTHQTTEADFKVFPDNTGNRHYIECKEMNLNKSTPTFAMSRFTQEEDLKSWTNRSHYNRGWLMLMYWNKTQLQSFTYLIPLQVYLNFKNIWTKKSINVKDAEKHFLQFKIRSLKGSVFDLMGQFK